jgi:hypothetical protein
VTAKIIDTVSGVTAAWLTAVLQEAGLDVRVGGVTAEPVGTGQMASCYRLHINYERGAGPATLVIKLPATDPMNRDAGALSYRCETSFYREVASKVSIRVPQCYWTALSENADVFTLLLEDLAPAQQGDQIAGCTIEQARVAAVNLAGLHGPTWCDSSLRDLNWLIPSGSANAEFVAAFLRDATATFVDRYELSAQTVKVLNQFAENSMSWWQQPPTPFALVHNDYRLDNLMFSGAQEADPVVAVDWQVLSVGLPLRDVALLLATGLQTTDRQVAERSIVADYHQALGTFGIENYSGERCWDHYRFALFQGVTMSVFGAAVSQPSERGDALFRVMAERSAAAITDLDSLSLL